jgi:iron complex transport system substrate-binding protein
MKSKGWALVALCAFLVSVLPMAMFADESAVSVQLVDDLGRLVTLNSAPERIISLAPSNTEILFALGLDEKIVGVTEYCDYPPQAKGKEVIGGFSTPDIEKIVALSPELILATSIHQQEVIPKLENKGLVVAALDSSDLNGVLLDIVMVGRLTGQQDEALGLVANLQSRIEIITDKTDKLIEQEIPRVFSVTWPDPIWTGGSGTIINELIVKAGGTNIFRDLDGWKQVDLESVIERNPEVIVAPGEHGWSKPGEWAITEARLEVTSARQNNRVYIVETNLVERAGPRIVDGLEEVASCIHPELFGELSSISSYPMEIIDQMGRTVTISTKPDRIISLSTANTEILSALGAASNIVGIDDASKQDLEEKVPELEEVGEVGSYAGVDIEKIIALQPDLVLAVPYQKQAVERLEKLGLPVVVLEARNIEAVLDNIKMIGRIIDREETTSILVANIEQGLKNIAESTSELAGAERPTALYLYEPMWVAGSNTMANDLIQRGGGVNIFSNFHGTKEVDIEAVIAKNPQVILCVQGYAPTLEYIAGEARLEGVAAVKNGRVYGIQASLVDIPGPRIIDALELIAGYLHPGLFEKGG